MKRYFLSHDDDMPQPGDNYGVYHFIELGSHGPAGASWNLIVLADNHVVPNPLWQAFPSLYDSKTTLAQSQVAESTLADLGLTGSETAIEAVTIFGGIHPGMTP